MFALVGNAYGSTANRGGGGTVHLIKKVGVDRNTLKLRRGGMEISAAPVVNIAYIPYVAMGRHMYRSLICLLVGLVFDAAVPWPRYAITIATV